MKPLTFTLHGVRTVSEMNRRDHWAVRAKRLKSHRAQANLACYIAIEHGPGHPFMLPRGGLKITLTRFAPGRLDPFCNLPSAFKGIEDGIADALGVDDGDKRLEWVAKQEKSRPGYYGVGVRIEERG